MKKFIIITVVVLLIGVLAFIVFSPSKNSGSQTAVNSQNPVSQALTEASNNQAVILDVRTPEEFNQGHSKNSTNFDLNNLTAGQMPEVAKDTKIYVYCRSGNRSNQAKIILNNNGYSNVTDLGGLENMKSGGAF